MVGMTKPEMVALQFIIQMAQASVRFKIAHLVNCPIREVITIKHISIKRNEEITAWLQLGNIIECIHNFVNKINSEIRLPYCSMTVLKKQQKNNKKQQQKPQTIKNTGSYDDKPWFNEECK